MYNLRGKLERVKPLLKGSAIMLSMTALSFAAGTASELFAPGTGVCKMLGLLPYAGVVAMTVGGTMAGISYMSHDQESKHKAKTGIEGLIVGGGLLLILPAIVGFFFSVAVCV